MTIELMDYQNKKVTFDIGNIEDIASIFIEVITGDEIATVLYKNYTTKVFDSSCTRNFDFSDYQYLLYDVNTRINLLNDEIFLNRKTSYDLELELEVFEWD